MQNLAHSVNIYGRLLRVQLQGQMQYRLSFVLEMLSTGITLSLFFISIALVLQRFGALGGWSLGEVAFLWGSVETSFGLMDMIFSGFDPQSFGQRIRLGAFDQLLLRPVNITIQVLGSEFVLRRLGRILQGVAILGIAFVLTDIQWTVAKVLYLPLVIGGMICFFGGLFIIGSTITFWTIESIEAMNIFTYGGSEMCSYPMHIYPWWLRTLFTYIVPGIFLNYYPAIYFLDKPDPLGMTKLAPFLSPFVGAGVLSVALAFWRFGIRHYQSTGS
ncbi:MAG: ABC-2 family transporter protein [Caldilineaceae bacterium]